MVANRSKSRPFSFAAFRASDGDGVQTADPRRQGDRPDFCEAQRNKNGTVPFPQHGTDPRQETGVSPSCLPVPCPLSSAALAEALGKTKKNGNGNGHGNGNGNGNDKLTETMSDELLRETMELRARQPR